jgi:hypothetical protein
MAARTVLTVQDIVRTGLNPALVSGDATNNHSFDNTGHNVFLHVITTGTAADVTIVTPNLVDGLAIGDLVVTMPATGERIIGPFPKALYDTIDTDPDPDIDPAIFVDLDADTGLTLGAFRLPDPSY